MTHHEVDFLLIGGGLASLQAAEALRREGATGSILILCAESTLPYHRPSLSKAYLLAEAEGAHILVYPEQFYREQQIDVALGVQATSVDTARQVVMLSTGSPIHYGKLLIATGSVPRPFPVPGASLAGIYTLRLKVDCDAIRQAASKAKRAVVVGGSFLGMEVAMSLRVLGLDVTVVEGDDRLLRHLESPVLSDFFAQHAQTEGVSIVLGDPAVAFHGHGKVSGVRMHSGKTIPCDMVVVCTGVEPATQFLEGSGIALDEGRIVVDDLLATNAPNVWAAGDVTSFLDPVFSCRRHIEHWDNAAKQGRLAGMNMLGRRLRYDMVSYFFCEVGEVGFSMLGLPDNADEWIARGSLNDRSFALFYLKDSVLRAEFSLGRSADETRRAEGLIRYRTNLLLQKDKLRDPAFALDQLPTQTVLILQGGGALGAFECGVVRGLEEHHVYPDIVAGVSIGALNGAIIAGNPKHPAEALRAFWSELQVPSNRMLPEALRQIITSMQILQFGVPKFFRPCWLPAPDVPWMAPWEWTGYYDTAPMKKLLAQYVDFESLKTSPIRLLVGAVNVLTAQLEVFDSYVDDLAPEHIVASGSLPPGFSWTFVNGKPYWDGGMVSNSPIDLVIDRCGSDGKRVFIVDLFSSEKPLPTNMMEVMARRDEIVYSERIRNDLRSRELTGAYRSLIDYILQDVDAPVRDKIRQRPRYIQLMGDGAPMNITRFIRKGKPNEPSSRDYDFSDVSIQSHQAQGYALVNEVLGSPPADAASPPGDAEQTEEHALEKWGA